MGVLQVRQYGAVARKQHLPFTGQRDLPRGAVEQQHAERGFQTRNALADCGSGQAEALSGLGKVQPFGNAHEGKDLAQLVHARRLENIDPQ